MSANDFREFSTFVRNYHLYRSNFLTLAKDLEKTEITAHSIWLPKTNHLPYVAILLRNCVQKAFELVHNLVECVHTKHAEFTMRSRQKDSNPFKIHTEVNEFSNFEMIGFVLIGMLEDLRNREELVEPDQREIEEIYSRIKQSDNENKEGLETYLVSWKDMMGNLRVIIRLYSQLITVSAQYIGHLDRNVRKNSNILVENVENVEDIESV